jgi:glycosyltransferase involved in cell wall biosynthesis
LPYNLPPQKLNIIPIGVDLKKFKNLNKKKKNQILFVGRLIPEKGLLELIRAVKLIAPRPKILAIVSETYSYLKYKERCLKEGKGFLKVKMNVPNNKTIKYYNESKLFTFPSWGIDSFGIVLIEAMACGLPVVCTNLPGPSSIVPSFAGVIVNPKNKKVFSDAIQKVLITNYDSSKIANYVKENFDYEIITNKVLEVYKK